MSLTHKFYTNTDANLLKVFLSEIKAEAEIKYLEF